MTPLYVMTYLPNLERLMMLPDTACEMQLWYVVMPWRLTLSLAPSWHELMRSGHLVLTLLMPLCSSAACCRMRGSCARWARWCSSAACCRTCDVDRVRDELETRLARETPRSDLVALPDTVCEVQPLYVVEYVPNLERLAMSWHCRRSGSAQGSGRSAPCRC